MIRVVYWLLVLGLVVLLTGTAGCAGVPETAAVAAAATPTLTRVVGFVFVDANGDGVRQADETAGVAGAALGMAGLSTLTDAGGWYAFDVPVGAYDLVVTLPAGWALLDPAPLAVVVGSSKQVVNVAARAVAVSSVTPTLTVVPTVGQTGWEIKPIGGDCFLARHAGFDRGVYRLCIEAWPQVSVFREPAESWAAQR